VKIVDFDIEKEPALWIQHGGQNQQNLHHNKQQDPDAMIPIPASAQAQAIGW
jgi:hypothetical protein